MGIERTNTALQDILQNKGTYEGLAELKSDIEQLLHTLDGDERVEAIIDRVQRYAVELGRIDTDLSKLQDYQEAWIKKIINQVLFGYISWFISDEHREFVVRRHAFGLSTGEAVYELVCAHKTILRLSQEDAVGYKNLRQELIHQLSYLKPGTTRWPEKKYGVLWREAREEYKREIGDVPLTSKAEQVRILAEHVARLRIQLQATSDAKEIKMLTSALNETIRNLQKLTPDEPPTTPANLSEPQLVAVLERLTIASNSPQMKAIEGESRERIGTLVEELTLALNLLQQVDGDNGAKSLPAETGVDEGKAK